MRADKDKDKDIKSPVGLEPTTSRLEVSRAIQLRHEDSEPFSAMLRAAGLILRHYSWI